MTSCQGRTAKLWIHYVEQSMQQFIGAEPSGYFALHLHLIPQMQPYIHATGRLQYAKSSQVFLQIMEDLEENMPSEEFKKFSDNSYFTFRCTSKIWYGAWSGVLVWSDMTIEQDLMRTMKTTVGLTRGRQISN